MDYSRISSAFPCIKFTREIIFEIVSFNTQSLDLYEARIEIIKIIIQI